MPNFCQQCGVEVGLFSRRADVFTRLATVHHRQGEPQKAKAMLERALQLDPAHPEARALTQELER